MRTSRVLFVGLGPLAFLLMTRSASATPSFPAAIHGDLGLSYEPPCSLCHHDGITGNGTVTTPFGKSMLARGLVAGDENSLSKALNKLGTDHVDSDADGVTDIDELQAGSDPNVDGGESLMGAPPAYGCGARMAPGEGFAGWAALATALGLAVGLRRRSR